LNFKNIILLSPAHPLRGGIAASSERLAQELQAQGAKVEIISFRLQYPGFLFPGKTQYTDDPAPEGLKISTLVNSINPFNWLKVGNQIRRAQPDLLIVRYWLPFMGPCLGTIARIAKRNKHTRVIAITDNVTPHEKRPGDRLLTRYFVNSADGFVVMSRSVGEDLRQFTASKPYRYTPHPIYDSYGELVLREAALRQLQLDENQRYILFFGFIRQYKGLDLLLRAMADERVRSLPIRLIVAGEFYDDDAPYRELIVQHHLTEKVILHDDFIPNEQVKYYFGAADLVVQPYRTATQSGISQLAFHFEKPMIVTRVGGLPEIVRHGEEGYVVDVDAAAIAEAIVDFFEHERQSEMTRNVRVGKARYGWDQMVAYIDDLYKQLTNG
jgi:glycosyltransferase involved in cell wall biosynthesis